MSDQRISQLADELESLAGDEKALLRSAEDNPPGWIFVSGNRAGLVRLAAFCLRASLAPLGSDHSGKAVMLDDSIDQGVLPNENDRRIVRVTVTEAGRRRLDRIEAVIRRTDEQVRSVLDADEQVVLQRALDKVFAYAHRELEGTEPRPFASPRSQP